MFEDPQNVPLKVSNSRRTVRFKDKSVYLELDFVVGVPRLDMDHDLDSAARTFFTSLHKLTKAVLIIYRIYIFLALKNLIYLLAVTLNFYLAAQIKR